jgi:hypothetical protein
MNKQEALKQIEEQRDMILDLHGWGVFGYIKGIINQLDEPQKIELPKVDFKKSQKVKVPQCVADWIEKCKNNFGFNLKSAMNINTILHYSDDCHKMIDWIKVNSNQETFARAWLDGYDVEKEKRYLVKIKATKHYIAKDGIGKIFFSLAYKESFTKKELEEAGFGWVFSCEGIEIEEVEG